MKRGYADTPEGQIHYITAGKGEPLLLIHQKGSSRQYWKMMPILAERYRTFAPDTLGSGNSDRLPPNVEIADLARSMVHFLDFLGIEKTNIFGFHTGNKIATEMAAAFPSRVNRLILSGHTHSIIPEPEASNAAILALAGSYIRKMEPEPGGVHLMKQWAKDFVDVTSMWWDNTYFAGKTLSPELFQQQRERVIDQLQIRDVSEQYRAIFAFDLGARMRQVKARTLIIEVVIPREEHLGRQGEKLVKLIPGSQLAIVKHTGNGIVVEVEAEEIARLILDFLKG